ncbi:hypothetical protein [Streptomyces spirodelae]|uniref:Uncharacterized protein n=1 Tax=Streptomyces spirodelae TaxID=2812904 RepID=A0ABS3X2D6_9ACTN|nr:hypothetical protein [Streptomyces spirodelae]MBO8189246.1 hypothetical protein [Streptomyces spirodelae]
MAEEAESGTEARGESEAWEAPDQVNSWSRFLAGLALAAVVTVVVMVCVPLKEEGAHAPCGPTIAPEDPYLHTVECNTRHIRQLGYAGLLLAGALGCGTVSFLLRIERRPPERSCAHHEEPDT